MQIGSGITPADDNKKNQLTKSIINVSLGQNEQDFPQSVGTEEHIETDSVLTSESNITSSLVSGVVLPNDHVIQKAKRKRKRSNEARKKRQAEARAQKRNGKRSSMN